MEIIILTTTVAALLSVLSYSLGRSHSKRDIERAERNGFEQGVRCQVQREPTHGYVRGKVTPIPAGVRVSTRKERAATHVTFFPQATPERLTMQELIQSCADATEAAAKNNQWATIKFREINKR